MPRTTRDDVSLHFELFGQGDGTPLLCLHGGGCVGADFAALAERFGAERRLVCPDMRGHGQTDAPEGGYDPATLAADVAAICASVGIRRVVVVGHSLGGAVALHLLDRDDLDIAALVSLDSPIAVSAPMLQGITMLRDVLADGDAGMPVFREFMGAVAGYPDDAAARARLVDHLCHVPARAMTQVLAGVAALDGAARLGRTTLPLLHVETGVGVSDVARVRELRPDAWIGQTAGTGHYPHLESPDQVVAMVRHFLARHQL